MRTIITTIANLQKINNMATKKLSEALAELQKAASVSGLDVRLVVAGNSSTDNAKTITLQQLLTALNVPTAQTGVVGNNQQYVYSVSSDNTHAVMSGTFKAFQYNGQCLIRHKFWGSTNDYTDGQYTTCEIPKVTTGANGVFEAAMLVRLRNTTLTEVNSTTDKVVVSYPNYANGSTKSLEISKATTAKAGVMTAEQVSALEQATTDIASLNSNMPTPQVGTEGYEGKYIFSHKSDNDRKVLSGNFKVISVNTGVEIQHRIWGATAYTDATTKKAKIPIVNPSQYGVMNKDVFKRMLYHTHYESGSSTKAVNIKYTNYETGGTNDLTISAASSAKAGVMTSEQYNQLTDLSKYQCGCLGTYTTTSAFKEALSNMPTTHKGKYGHYYAEVSGIYVYITFVSLSSDSYSQWVEGPMIKSSVDGDIYLNNELGVHIIGRVFQNGSWGYWRSNILDDELPIVATTTNDGLMSKEDKALLMKIKEKLEL